IRNGSCPRSTFKLRCSKSPVFSPLSTSDSGKSSTNNSSLSSNIHVYYRLHKKDETSTIQHYSTTFFAFGLSADFAGTLAAGFSPVGLVFGVAVPELFTDFFTGFPEVVLAVAAGATGFWSTGSLSGVSNLGS